MDDYTHFINRKRNPFFTISVTNGKYTCGLQDSYYAQKFPDADFSFNVSNNKVLSTVNEFGTLIDVAFYHDCFYCDDIPGVWTAKDFTKENDFYYEITVGNKHYDLSQDHSAVQADLMDNILPRVSHYYENFTATTITCAPISCKGERLNVLIYALCIENQSKDQILGDISLPKLFKKKYSDVKNVSIELLNGDIKEKKINFKLQPNCSLVVPVIFYRPGEYGDVEKIAEKGTLFWMKETIRYFKQMVGDLTIEQDPLTAAIYERAVYQAFGALAMNSKDQMIGSNWGTFPVTARTWNKDMFYSILPFTNSDPELFKKGILWFCKYGIRPKGGKYSGDIFHSLSNSLVPVIMAGLYYDVTGDKTFFLNNPQIYKKLIQIMDSLQARKSPDDPYLFPSLWYSDAFSLGKYHTGSNICVWKAYKCLARISREIFGEGERSQLYDELSERVKTDIETYLTCDGPFGKQYLEGVSDLTSQRKTMYPLSNYKKEFLDQAIDFLSDVIEGEQVNLVMHDGEESDTTLIPFYGYKPIDDQVLRNYVTFTTSRFNPTYNQKSKGIRWGNKSGATFPGYMLSLLGDADHQATNESNGFVTELKHLVDLDGSWWWWPYKLNAETGNVVRMNSCGKCGWASGIFSSLFTSQIIGLIYDAPSETLFFKPLSSFNKFTWTDVRLGNARFDIGYEKKSCKDTKIKIVNKNDHLIKVNVQILTDGTPFDDGEKQLIYTEDKFLKKRVVRIAETLSSQKILNIITK